MSQSFLQLTDVHGSEIDINTEAIDSYTSIGGFTRILVRGQEYNVLDSVSSIRRAISELYVTLKKVRE